MGLIPWEFVRSPLKTPRERLAVTRDHGSWCVKWYPATDEARDAVESYVLHEYLPPDLKEQVPAEALGSLTTAALRDGEPRYGRGPFPLVMLSHGKVGYEHKVRSLPSP